SPRICRHADRRRMANKKTDYRYVFSDERRIVNMSSAKPDGRALKGQATRQRLITAGRVQFGTRGFEATSIETVLKQARITRGALYHHFATKEALFDAVLEQV